MASVRCTSCFAPAETTSSSWSTTLPFRRASATAQFSARACPLPTSSYLNYGSITRNPLAHAPSRGNSFKIPAKKSGGMLIQAQQVSFKATRKVTIPFREGAFSGSDYLKETERIVKVTFPDSTRIEYLGDQNWRSRLRPITFISVSATPSVEMRVSYEKGALRLHSSNLFLDFSGVPENFAVADFSFSLDGSLRATPRSAQANQARHNSDFAGSVSLGLSTDLPPAFALIPDGIVTRVGDEILDRIIGAMEGALLQGIIRDYNIWSRMKSRKSKAANPSQPAVPLRTSTS